MDSHDIESYFRQHRKTLAVVFLAVSMLAVSGFFMGMRQTEQQVSIKRLPVSRNPIPSVDPSVADIPTAPKYKDIPETSWQKNRNWHFTLADLPQAIEPAEPAPALTPDELNAAVKRRASLRAFDGAPPVVPHAIDTISVQACITCHGTGEDLVIGGTRPAEMSHPWITSCTSCHIPADGLRKLTAAPDTRLVVESSFVGKSSTGHGPRAYGGAPPVTPHAVWMRQNCLACHGPGREQAIRSSHPQRKNCLQCHAPNSAFDNRESYMTPPAPLAGSPPPLKR